MNGFGRYRIKRTDLSIASQLVAAEQSMKDNAIFLWNKDIAKSM